MSRFLLVDSYPILRSALRELVSSLGHEVVAECGDGREALQSARTHRPEFVILDLAVPHSGGLELVQRLHAHMPELKVLVYTGQSPRHFALRSARAGARGFVSKFTEADVLKDAIATVVNGRRSFPDVESGATPAAAGTSNELDALSSRELTVLQMLVSGLSNNEIAEQLALSWKTVSTYKTRLQEKLNASSLAELIEIVRHHQLNGFDSVASPDERAPDEDRFAPLIGILHSLLDPLPAVFALRDRAGRLRYCNPRFVEYYGVAGMDVTGTSIAEATWFEPAFRARAEARFQALLDAPSHCEVEGVHRINGEPRTLKMWASPYRDKDGRSIGLIICVQDETRRDDLIARLRDARKRADLLLNEYRLRWEQANAALRGPVEAMDKKATRAEAVHDERALPDFVHRSSHTVLCTLADLDELIHVESGAMPLHREVASLKQLLQDWQATAPDSVTIDDAGIMQDEVWVDGHRFLTVVDRLATRWGRPVSIRISSELRPLGMAGIDIDARRSGPLDEDDGDVGIALALCEAIVRLSGGHFAVEGDAHIHVSIDLPLTAHP
ncbi:MAG: response regulator [Rhodocyclaceae bacterium]